MRLLCYVCVSSCHEFSSFALEKERQQLSCFFGVCTARHILSPCQKRID